MKRKRPGMGAHTGSRHRRHAGKVKRVVAHRGRCATRRGCEHSCVKAAAPSSASACCGCVSVRPSGGASYSYGEVHDSFLRGYTAAATLLLPWFAPLLVALRMKVEWW